MTADIKRAVLSPRDGTRPQRLDAAPLDYAPENELGVVFLFSHLARRRFGLRVEGIGPGFPDCIAYRGGKQVRIEFEYRSSNFAVHGHDPEGCDWIVCWIHDWPRCPRKIRVVELRREFGLGFNVWIVPITGKWRAVLDRTNYHRSWSAPSEASAGDLILFYRTKPYACVKDIFRLTGPVSYERAQFKGGMDYFAPIRRVATVRAPIYLSQLRTHPVLRSAGFVRGSIRSRYRITAHWPEIHDMIIDRNPGIRKSLHSYGPHRLS